MKKSQTEHVIKRVDYEDGARLFYTGDADSEWSTDARRACRFPNLAAAESKRDQTIAEIETDVGSCHQRLSKEMEMQECILLWSKITQGSFRRDEWFMSFTLAASDMVDDACTSASMAA